MHRRGYFFRAVLLIVSVCTLFLAVSITSAFYLPDTGQTKCYSDKGAGKLIACPAPGHPLAQDGSYSINPPSYSIFPDWTVADNNTFLMWQQADVITHSTMADAEDYCGNLTLGGHADWRLPSKKELSTIIHYGKYNPAIDTSAFNNTLSYPYWTSTADLTYITNGWQINFADGSAGFFDSSIPHYTRCVRRNIAYSTLKNNGNSTISDIDTGLMWQKSSSGSMAWASAIKYCEGLTLAGYTDWRLPNIRELVSLTEDRKRNPSIDSNLLEETGFQYNYWSSTPSAGNPDNRWVVSFSDSSTSTQVKTNKRNYARCVRGQKRALLDYREISINPGSIDYGYLGINETYSKEIIVSNLGMEPLTIGTLSNPSAPFSIVSDQCSDKTVAPWQSCTATVAISPSAFGIFTDSVIVPSNDADHPFVKVPISATIAPGGGRYLLPDTGQTACFISPGYQSSCPGPGAPWAQDGSYTINPMSFTDNTDGTVTDNNTLLVWQRYEEPVMRAWNDALDYCENLILGGHAGWRLPTWREYLSIRNYDTLRGLLNSEGFPDAGVRRFYATAESYSWPSTLYPVKCVKGGSLPYGPLLDNGNGTVTETATGLMWQQIDPGSKGWADALAHCEGLTLGGYSDWRLPNIKELFSLVEEPEYDPAVDMIFFPTLNHSYYGATGYWTSTNTLYKAAVSSVYDQTYVISFYNGATVGGTNYLDVNKNYFRCVRGGNIAFPAALTGTVTDSSSSLPISEVSVTVTDSEKLQSADTDSAGEYTFLNLTAGTGTATFSKAGFSTRTKSFTLTSGQTQTLHVQLTLLPPLYIVISSPKNSALLASSPISVTGTVTDNASVSVNGIPADVENNSFSASIPISEGHNTVTATASDQYGRTASESIYVTLSSPKPPDIGAIIVTSITTDSAIISWTTDQPSDSFVEYGETPAFGSTASDAGLATSHSITLSSLIPDRAYHFKVRSKNAEGRSASSGDNTFATLKFMARTLGDFGNVTVIEVAGDYDAKNPDGSMNAVPRQEIAREFLRTRQDQYDFMVVLSNFDFAMPQAGARAFYLEVKNDTQGTGKPIFDSSASFGSNGKLQGMIDMGNIAHMGIAPFESVKFNQTLETLSHEQMHRWGAEVRFRGSGGNISSALLGKDEQHWSYLLDTDGSLMYGNDWKDNKDGTFTSISASRYYSPLDLYLMGFYDKTQVPPMLLIGNPAIDPVKLPEAGATVSGTPRMISIDDIIAAEGERVPNEAASQKTFRTAFIYITRPDTFLGTEPPGIEMLRNAWAGRFAELTHGKGLISDVAPALSITITSPSEGQTISASDVMVRGTVINSSGRETGVTVNGMPVTVYNNQFIANHVPLAEGQNTIAITATDSAGNTATTQIAVNAVSAGHYIRLVSNIESGIPPMEVMLRVDGSFSVSESNLGIVGPVQPEVISSATEEYRLKFSMEGVYYITVTAQGPDGLPYQDTVAITVINRNQLDMLLKAKWEGMKESLMNGDVEKGLIYFKDYAKDKYRRIFSALISRLPMIASGMQDISMCHVSSDVVEYRISRLESIDDQIKTITYFIYFSIDKDGLWKIESL